jgi:glycosyltransferase involved in cell wall biosynthesis
MMSQSFISVIIIFLNGETFIEEAILSVFAQTYRYWELLLVDDGSTDQSTATAKEYAQKHLEKVRYLEHEGHQNQGMSASRNLGIAHSRGEYVAFLDSDDIWLPEKLEKQLQLFQENPEAAVVCGPTQWWYSWTGNPNHKSLDSIREIVREYDCLYEPPVLLKELLLDRARTPATCSALIRRSLFDEVGLFEEQFKGLYEDQAFFSKVYLKANVYISRQYWDLYRQHSKNHCLISERTGQGTPGYLNTKHQYFLQWLKRYLLSEEVQEPHLLKALHQALWAYEHQRLYYLLNPERFLRMIGRKTLPFMLRQWLWARYITIKGVDL